MHTIVWVPLESSSWTDKLSSISGLAAAVISLLAVVLAYCAWRTSQNQLNASRAQDLALRLDAQLVALSTGELAAARSRVHSLARAMTWRRAPANLSPAQRDDVFQLLWALQRVSVLVPVISTSHHDSIRVLREQITQIVDTLATLGNNLTRDAKKSMCDAVIRTEESLGALEWSLTLMHSTPEPLWSDSLHTALCIYPRCTPQSDETSGQV